MAILAVAALVVIGASAPSAAVTLLSGQIVVTAIPDEAVVVLLEVPGPDPNQDVIASGGFLRMPIGVAAANGQTGPVVLVLDRTCCSGAAGVIAVNPTDGSQTIVSPVSGAPSFFERPTGIAVAPDGAVFVSDATCCGGQGGVIQMAADGSQTVVSSGQLFRTPVGIAVTVDGALYVADQQSGLIHVSLPGGEQTVVMVEGVPITPQAVASAVNRLRVIQRNAQNEFEVVEVTPATGLRTTFTAGQRLAFPVGLAASAFAVYVADSRCCDIGGVIVASPPGNQTILASGNSLNNPTSIAVVPEPPVSPERSCGGSVPCACGDRVVRDHTLRGADPVTRMVCPADGLMVASGVTLDLGGATLEGRGAGVGVRLEAGAAGVTVRGGTLRGFATGVRGEPVSGTHLANLNVRDNAGDGVVLGGEGQIIAQSAIDNNGGRGVVVLGSNSRLSSVRARGNARVGILVAGSEGALEQITAADNGGHGVELRGDGSHVLFLQARGNGGAGAVVTGAGNSVARSVATRNAGDGLHVEGRGVAIELNQLQDNGEAGLELHGQGHRVARNVAGRNGGSGFEMIETTASHFDRNRGENNAAFGMADDSRGAGTGGTANTSTRNVCGRGNASGASSPPGLCR